jgi:hypothetical protein
MQKYISRKLCFIAESTHFVPLKHLHFVARFSLQSARNIESGCCVSNTAVRLYMYTLVAAL